MELLVVTLAHSMPGRGADGLARIRLISDTVRNAQGLVIVRIYRSRGRDAYYFILTTWEDEEYWQKAQERYNPKNLLLTSASELLTASPEQWSMHYLWGYSRPSATPTLAAAHLATIRPEQAERTQRAWIESLRRQVVQPVLAFAFLARGTNENTFLPSSTTGDSFYQHDSVFLNLLSWSSETEQQAFYEDSTYQAINRYLGSVGVMQILPLDPM